MKISKKLISISISILSIIIVISLIVISYRFARSATSMEYFTVNTPKLSNYNLLHNGSFQNGGDIGELADNRGSGKVVRMGDNPSCNNSSYVLQLGAGAGAYILSVKLEPKLTYTLTYYGTDNVLSNIKLKKNNINSCASDADLRVSNIGIIDTVTKNDMKWHKYQYQFTVPDYSDGEILIYLGCVPPATANSPAPAPTPARYLTDVVLLPFLPKDPKFGATIGLQTFLDAQNQNSCQDLSSSLIWYDISQRARIYHWDRRPEWSADGYIKTGGNILEGPAGNSLGIDVSNGMEFSFVIYARSMPPAHLGNQLMDINPAPVSVLYLSGNQGTAFEFLLPNGYGNLGGRFGSEQVNLSDKKVNTNDDIVYTITHKNGRIEIWMNDAKFYTVDNVNRMYFDGGKLMLNHNRDWNANIYSFMIYNRKLDDNTVKYVGYYLKFRPAYNQPMMSLQPIPAPMPISSHPDHPMIPHPMMPMPMPSPSGNDHGSCNPMRDCPEVHLTAGEYFVNVPPGSIYAKRVGCGVQSYGRDKKKAQQIYQMNFPDCPLPNALRFERPPAKDCPFIIEKHNPCNSASCDGVDWSVLPDGNAQSAMTQECRKHVSHYCNVYKDLDPRCLCWKDENKLKPECQRFRRGFEPPEEYGYNVNVFNIEEHPDMRNYVRKDKVPCWNCNLTDS